MAMLSLFSFMNKNLYREAFAHSWRLATKHIWLWPFGLFAALLGQLGVTELLSALGVIKDQYGAATSVQLILEIFRGFNFSNFSNLNFLQWGGAVWILFIWILLAIVLTFIAISSQGALIHAASKPSHRIKAFHPASSSWHVGVRHFWRLFALTIVKKAGLLLLGLLVAWVSYRSSTTGSLLDQSIFVITFLVALFVGLSLSFYTIYAACYVIVEEYDDKQALQAAWSLLKDHPIVSIEVALILLVLNIGMALFSILSFFLFLVPAGVVWILGAVISSQLVLSIAIIVGLLSFVIFVMFIGAMFTIYSTSTWTYLFMKMHKNGVKSHVMHMLGK